MRLEPVAPGTAVRLTDARAAPPRGAPGKADALEQVAALGARIDALQEALYGEGRRALLAVLQGRDTAGKDGAIRKVFGAVDPQGLTVTSFKAPTPQELAHDYLWRIHQAVPARGPSVSSTARITRTCWRCGCTGWSRNRSGAPATSRSIGSSRSCPRTG